LRVSGHSYDSYDSAVYVSEISKFVNDYNNIKNLFRNATYILTGSHRDSYHPQNKLDVMFDLGAPSNLSSILTSAPEWILVGKPGLGAGNAYGWAFQNYTTNAAQVAHLNFALPVYGNKDNYLSFDGIDDYISLPNNIGYTDKFTATAWFRHKGNPGGGYHIIFGGVSLEVSIHVSGFLRLGVNTSNGRNVSNFGSGLTDGNWHHVAFVYNGTHRRAYIDGNYIGESSVSGTLEFSFSNRNIGKFGSDNTYWLNGDLAVVSLYNRDLNNDEIKQNFEAIRGRYGI
jgi:hypothetical protein